VTGPRTPAPGRLPPVDEAHLDDERRAVIQQVAAGRGRIPTPYRVWVASPALARRLHPLGQYLAGLTSLTKPEAEIVILSAARRWGGDYVLAVHAREADDAGLDASVVAAIAAGHAAEPADPRQRAVADMMAALGSDSTPPDGIFDAAVAMLGHGGVAEALALAGSFTAIALAMKMYAVPLPAE